MMSTPLAATVVDAAALADELARFRILPADRLSDLLAEFTGGGPVALAEFLVGRGVLTPYQADRVLAGECRALTLGPYRLTGVLRRGPLGPVLRAEKGGVAFAIRVLPLRSLWQARHAKQLVRTLAPMGAHPAVAPLVDADSANGYHYLVWPPTAGELLGDLVRTAGPILPAEAPALLARLAAALAACHARQIVHGLLTPDAVTLGVDNAPRILELGAGALLARNLAAEESLFDTLSSAIAVSGAFGYAAPEWVADPTRPTPATDQYALGAVGYFALTGRPPPLTGTPSVAEANPAVPAALAEAVDRLLRPDPADRFSGMDEVREVFAGLAGHQPVPDPVEDSHPPAATGLSGRTDLSAQSGRISWGSAGPTTGRPPERDDTDASVLFDLPEPQPEARPPSARHAETPPAIPADQPSDPVPTQDLVETPREMDTRRAEPRRGGSPAAGGSRLLTPLDQEVELPPLPVLPVLPLLPTDPSAPEPPAPTPDPPATDAADAPAASPTPSGSVLWKRVRRKVMFWQTPTDAVQVSVFGPRALTHGQTRRVTVYLHPPSAAESVGTLARVFQQDAILLTTGPVSQEVVRGARLAVHLAIGHAVVTTPLVTFSWRGQPHRLSFDLAVEWEAPVGQTVGVVSIGQEDVRIGKAEFELPILAGKN